jgi:hypothetical protein
VAEIQDFTSVAHWRHVPTACNPADFISKGTSPSTLITNILWWKGPQWLSLQPSLWPSLAVRSASDHEFPKERTCLLTFAVQPEDFSRLIRAIAYYLRFTLNCKVKKKSIELHLSAEEVSTARLKCVQLVQRSAFEQEEEVSLKSTLKNLIPFIDSSGLLRVGGRLQKLLLPFDVKHQMILPPKHYFTNYLLK